jgi:translin
MSIDQLQESLKTIGDELKDAEERREKLLKGTRDIISLCSKSIVDQHFGKEKEAVEKITNARIMLYGYSSSISKTDIRLNLHELIVSFSY